MKKLFLSLVFVFIGHILFAQKNYIDQPYIEVSAQADSLVTPDRIYLNITINEADSKNKKSVERQEKEMETALKKLGIKTEKDLTLANAGSNFRNYFLRGQNVVKSKRYELLIKDAVMVGNVLLELEKIGISNIYLSKMEYSKKEDLLLSLKAQAVAKTKKIAQGMTKPLGQKVGKAIHISDKPQAGYYRDDYMLAEVAPMAKAAVADAPINIEVRKLKFESGVLVKYILE